MLIIKSNTLFALAYNGLTMSICFCVLEILLTKIMQTPCLQRMAPPGERRRHQVNKVSLPLNPVLIVLQKKHRLASVFLTQRVLFFVVKILSRLTFHHYWLTSTGYLLYILCYRHTEPEFLNIYRRLKSRVQQGSCGLQFLFADKKRLFYKKLYKKTWKAVKMPRN
jgi:hypothetical protein